MDISSWKSRLSDGKCDSEFLMLYGAPDAARERYERLCDEFLLRFGNASRAALISAPGRTELAGNHTDHQLGIVLCGSVTLDAAAAAAPTGDEAVEIFSDGFGQITVSLQNLAVRKQELGTPAAIVRGAAAAFAARGLKIGGWRACIRSDVPVGGGLSSSAAFEILIGSIFSLFYNDNRVDALTLAQIGQSAERDYFGKPSGLLDQTASACGGIAKIDFAEPEHPLIERISFDFRSLGYVLCAVNTHTSHDDLTADYASVPHDMTAVANALGQPFLRRVRYSDFDCAATRKKLSEELSDTAVDRAEHFFQENIRVERMADALKSGDMKSYMENMNASGRSSRYLLRNIVPAAHPERTEMAVALDRAEALLRGKGAWRIHGGGFAGCIQCLVPAEDYPAFRRAMDGFYGDGSCFELRIRPFGAYVFGGEA